MLLFQIMVTANIQKYMRKLPNYLINIVAEEKQICHLLTYKVLKGFLKVEISSFYLNYC